MTPAERVRIQAIREASRRDFELDRYFHRSPGNVEFAKKKNAGKEKR